MAAMTYFSHKVSLYDILAKIPVVWILRTIGGGGGGGGGDCVLGN